MTRFSIIKWPIFHLTNTTRKEVKEKMTKALAEVQDNIFIEKSDITLYDLAKEIVEDKKTQMK